MPQTLQFVTAVAFAVPCFVMGARLLRVWRSPMQVENGRWVQLGVGVFVLEFILLHASMLFGGIAATSEGAGPRIGVTLGLAAFYALFAGAIALAFRSRMLLNSFLWLIGGRFVALAVGAAEHEPQLFLIRSAGAFALYLVLVTASVFLPVPRLGITAEVAAAKRVPNSRGVWADHPHRAIGAAAVYFLLLGVFELAVMSWIDPRMLAAR